MALAHFSRAKGLYHLALIIALSWVLTVAIHLVETFTGARLYSLYPIKDGLIAAYIIFRGWRPNYPGKFIYTAVALILAVQATYRLFFTQLELTYIMKLGLNLSFLFTLALVCLLSIQRIIRIHREKVSSESVTSNGGARSLFSWSEQPHINDESDENLVLFLKAVWALIAERIGWKPRTGTAPQDKRTKKQET